MSPAPRVVRAAAEEVTAVSTSRWTVQRRPKHMIRDKIRPQAHRVQNYIHSYSNIEALGWVDCVSSLLTRHHQVRVVSVLPRRDDTLLLTELTATK